MAKTENELPNQDLEDFEEDWDDDYERPYYSDYLPEKMGWLYPTSFCGRLIGGVTTAGSAISFFWNPLQIPQIFLPWGLYAGVATLVASQILRNIYFRLNDDD